MFLAAGLATAAGAQTAPLKPAVTKHPDGTYAIGSLRVDTVRHELTVPGTINETSILEFVANTIRGAKAYESAITLDSDAITFNAALLLLGLDPKRSVVPKFHFDPTPPDGDPVDIFVEITTALPQTRPDRPSEKVIRRMRVEELLFDQRTGKTIPAGPWVYTGSTFVEDLNGRRYMAELDGVLIGFVHSPSPIIENPRSGAVNGYGSVVLNPALGPIAGSSVVLTIKALRPPTGRR